MAHHLDTLGILFLIYGVLQAVAAMFLVGMYLLTGVSLAGLGVAQGDGGAVVVGGMMAAVSIGGGVLALLFTMLPIAAAVGIRRRAAWGRIVAFVEAALSLTSFPFGTALGVFAFVVLLDKEAAAEFDS